MLGLNRKYQELDKTHRIKLDHELKKLRGRKKDKVMLRALYSLEYQQMMSELFKEVTKDSLTDVKYFVQIKFNHGVKADEGKTIVNDGFLWSDSFLPYYYQLLRYGKVSPIKKEESQPSPEPTKEVEVSQKPVATNQIPNKPSGVGYYKFNETQVVVCVLLEHWEAFRQWAQQYKPQMRGVNQIRYSSWTHESRKYRKLTTIPGVFPDNFLLKVKERFEPIPSTYHHKPKSTPSVKTVEVDFCDA